MKVYLVRHVDQADLWAYLRKFAKTIAMLGSIGNLGAIQVTFLYARFERNPTEFNKMMLLKAVDEFRTAWRN